MYFSGPAREAFECGVQLARGFPPRGKWTYGEVFHPAVVPQQVVGSWLFLYLQDSWQTSCIGFKQQPDEF